MTFKFISCQTCIWVINKKLNEQAQMSTKIIFMYLAAISLSYLNLFLSRGYSVQKILWECAAIMGSKISLFVYEWPLIKCTIWYMNGLIFKICPNLSQNILGNFGKNRWFCSKFGPQLDWLVYEWVTFSWKIGICMGLLQILWRHIPTKTKL